MLTAWNIASSMRPNDPTTFMNYVKDTADETGLLTLRGMTIVPAPGCNNYGLLLQGDVENAEKFVLALTMALMPSKYSKASLVDPALYDGVFTCTLED